MKTTVLSLMAVVCLSAEDAPNVPLLVAQRDYAIARASLAEAQQELQRALAELQKRMLAAQQACEKQGKQLDMQAVSCVAPPAADKK